MVQDVIGSVMTMNENGNRASPASILAKLNKGEWSKLRVYIGAAAGVGKTYKMLEDAHLLKKRLLRIGSRIAGRLASDWYTVYVETPNEAMGRIKPEDYAALQQSIRFAEELGANVIRLKSRRVAEALIEFAKREGITHVVFGQASRSRWDIVLHGSVINRFLDEVRDATVQVVPLEQISEVNEHGGGMSLHLRMR